MPCGCWSGQGCTPAPSWSGCCGSWPTCCAPTSWAPPKRSTAQWPPWPGSPPDRRAIVRSSAVALRRGVQTADTRRVTCPSCGAHNPEGSEWCERCLLRFDAVPSTTPNLAESKNAFVRTGSTTLTRQTARGPLVFVEPGGGVQATVLSQQLGKGQGESLAGALVARDSLLHLNERHTVIDCFDVPVFHVERYRA